MFCNFRKGSTKLKIAMPSNLEVGVGKADITGPVTDTIMMGFGTLCHYATASPLSVRHVHCPFVMQPPPVMPPH
jgi:hypothetical protein